MRDPDGHRIELYTGDYLTSDPDFKPIRWDLNDPLRQTFWGHEAPDRWFTETSTFIDIDTGEEIDSKEPLLKQRKPKIGVTQIVEHPSLNAAFEGFKQAIEDAGLEVEYDIQNAQMIKVLTQQLQVILLARAQI